MSFLCQFGDRQSPGGHLAKFLGLWPLTHWGRVTQICVSKFTIIGSDNGLSPIRRQAIIWTNAGILLIRTLGTNFSEILIQIHTFSIKKMWSGKCRPFCLGLNVLTCEAGHFHAVFLLYKSAIYHLVGNHTFEIYVTSLGNLCLSKDWPWSKHGGEGPHSAVSWGE